MRELFVKSSGVICERSTQTFPTGEGGPPQRWVRKLPLRGSSPTFTTGEGAARTGRRMRSGAPRSEFQINDCQWQSHHKNIGTQNRCGEPPGEFVQALGSPGRGAGPAIAGSEGSGFSLEKPPPEAECRPGYLESPVFAPPAQGLAKGQAGTPQSAALPAPLPGEPLSVRIRPSFLIPLLCTALV